MLLTKIAGLWRKVVALPVNAGGTVKPVQTGYVKVSGAWKIFFQAFKAIKFSGTCGSASGNKFHYELISNVNVTIASGDKLIFEMYPQGSICYTGVDGMSYNADGSTYANLRDFGYDPNNTIGLANTSPIVDQNGRHLHSQGSGVSAIPLNKWNYRVFDISVLAGKTLKLWAVVFESDTAGDYTTYYRYIRVEDKDGNVKATVFDSALGVPGISTYQSTTNGYSNIAKSVVTAPL